MDTSFYWLGILYAILSGCTNNFGTVLQKKVINDHRDNSEFLKNLVKSPLWLTGLLIQLVLGTLFMILAYLYIGPAIAPGIMASGLIILAIGAVYIVGESLKKSEMFAIFLMIMGIFLIGLSELSIDIRNYDLIEPTFILRTSIFSGSLVTGILVCEISQRKTQNDNLRGIFLIIESGLLFSIGNLWLSNLMGVMGKVLGGSFRMGELILFIIASVLLIIISFFGVIKTQQALKAGKASNLIPIQQLPLQISPIFYYFFVFLLIPPNQFSIVYMIIAIVLILTSSFLLGKRQAQIENIQSN